MEGTKKILLSRFKGDLAFIENPENYYAMFKNVIDKCASAQLGNVLLYEEGHFNDDEYTCNVSRIQRAKEHAIIKHGEWTIKAFERSKTQHTSRTFVSSVYSDIWGIELPGVPDDAVARPQNKKSIQKENVVEFNERLLLAMRESRITQRELAKKINLNETAVSRYVNGSRKPRMDILVNIARALNVSVEYLTGKEEGEIEFQELKNVLCRILYSMSPEQRLELMQILAR